MKQIPKIAKWVILLIVSFTGLKLTAQNVEAELQEYFYPFAKFSYIRSPDSENPNLVVTRSLSNGNILTETTEMWMGLSAKTVSESAYKLTMDEDRQAIVSTQQIIKNVMIRRASSDKITMFILPKDDTAVSWEESVNGDTVICTAKFVYITFTCDRKKLYRKAVKIEKTTPLDTSSHVKEWSYWVKGLSRLATYGYWRTPDNVSCFEKSVNISLDDPITEISEEEYNDKL